MRWAERLAAEQQEKDDKREGNEQREGDAQREGDQVHEREVAKEKGLGEYVEAFDSLKVKVGQLVECVFSLSPSSART